MAWRDFEGGLVEIGHDGEDFAFDNEGPRHRVWLEPFALASRPTSCGEYLAFIEDGGYRRPEFWLSAGWDCVSQRGWTAPLYWEHDGASWRVFTLSGLQSLDPDAPVCHVSGFEAAAFAKWAGKRLPREGRGRRAPALKTRARWEGPQAIRCYPGYREPYGSIGEYTAVMATRWCCAGVLAPRRQGRPTYRNLFPPEAR